MATQKKPNDPSDAALSAIEEALGMLGTPADKPAESAKPSEISKTTEAAKPGATISATVKAPETLQPAEIKKSAEAPKLPRVDDIDIFKPLPLDPPAQPPLAPASEKPAAEAEKPSKPAKKPTAPAEDIVTEPMVVPRRSSVLPANDDRRNSIADLLQPLREPLSRGPLVLASILSLCWLIGAAFIIMQNDGLFYAADGTMRANREAAWAVAIAATVLPVLFVFGFAAFIRRARELKATSKVMAEIASRLVEPEQIGAEAVFTLGQAVRREVSSIGDGVDRAVSRAGELERLVHGEVVALERSYTDNEYKMRALVSELSAEREALMATAERIRVTIDAAHQGFSADIGKAGESVAGAIDEASKRATFLISGKQDELIATLDRSSLAASELINQRTTELADRLSTTSRDTTDQLSAVGSSVIGELQRVNGGILDTLREATATIGTTLSESGERVTREVVEATDKATSTLQGTSSALITEWQQSTEAAARHIEETGASTARLLSETGANLKSEFTETAEVVNAAFLENSRTVMEEVATRAVDVNAAMQQASIDLINGMESQSQSFVSVMDARSAEAARRIEETGDKAAEAIGNRGEAIATQIAQALTQTENTFASQSQILEAALEQQSAKIADTLLRAESTLSTHAGMLDGALDRQIEDLDSRLAERGLALADLVGAKVDQANELFTIASDTLGTLIVDRTKEASSGLKAEIDQLGFALMQHSAEATERLAGSGRDVVQAITQQGMRVNEALAANANTLSDTITQRMGGMADRFATFEKTFVEKAGVLEDIVGSQGEALAARIAERTSVVSSDLERLLGRIETGLDERARTLGDQVALRTVEFNRVVNESGKDLLGGLETRVAQYEERVVAPLGRHVGTLDGHINGGLEAINARATEISTLLDEKGSRFVTQFEARGRVFIEGIETSAQDLSTRITTSLNALNNAINSGSADSLNALASANDRLRGDVTTLLGKLGEANGLLTNIVGSATQNLAEVEGRMSERVRGLEATLSAILSAASQGSDALTAKVDAIRAASGSVLEQGQGLTRELDGRAETLQALAKQLSTTQAQVSSLLAERQQAFEGMAGTLAGRLDDMDSMLRSFSSLVEDQLASAQAKARETSSLVHETAENAALAISSQFERVRLETGKERERTASALRAAYEQANSEMSTLFQRSLDGFSSTAGELRQASAEILRDLDATRSALAAGSLEIPREAREATANLKRVVSDQMRALSELQSIVTRSDAALDVSAPASTPRRAPEPEAPRIPLRNPEPAPRAAAPARPAAQPGGSWLSGLLERASDDDAPPARTPRINEPSSANRIESLDSLSVDIARMIDHDTAIELWDRYRKGDRTVFTRRLYTLQGQEAYDDIRRRYRRDAEFKKTVDAYVDQFERLLQQVAGDDRDSLVARTYLTSDTGKVYTMLAHASGRFD